MSTALQRHDDLARQAIERNGGHVFKTVGDAFCAAYRTAGEALAASLDLQLKIEKEPWPQGAVIRVRVALHTGVAQVRNNDYFGVSLSRVGRLLSAGHGGQILLSQTTYDLVQDRLPDGVALRPMGTHRLRDLSRPEEVFQLEHRDLDGEFPALKTLDNLPNNLPRQLTNFIGREKELKDLRKLFEENRLLTLTGVGGTGKTRLAIQFAADQLHEFADGVWFADLAPVSDPDFVPNSLAEAMGFKQEKGKTITETLIARLRDKEILVVLDNCEHLLDASASLAETLVRSCDAIKVLATSREGFSISGEQMFSVRSLPTPGDSASANELEQFDAVRLFMDRACLANPEFALNEGNAKAIAAICTRLDGIPLAIELAAARIRSMTPGEINDRLDQKFRLLTGGVKAALKRQQTLQGLIDWSYDLLNDHERALLQRISVFRGGLVLKSAETVCSDDLVESFEVLDLLSSLVDKSLVVVEQSGDSSRYMLLETIRDYATEKLANESDPTNWRRRHHLHFTDLALNSQPYLRGGEKQQAYFIGLSNELDNIRAALDWAAVDEVSRNSGLCLIGALHKFWNYYALFAEARTRTLALLGSQPVCTSAQSAACHVAGVASTRLTDYEAARTLLNQSYAAALELGEQPIQALALNAMGNLNADTGDFDAAYAAYQSAIALAATVEDPFLVTGILNNLARIELMRGEYEKSAQSFKAVVERARQLSQVDIETMAYSNLGLALLKIRDLEGAKTALRIGFELAERSRNAFMVPHLMHGLGYALTLDANLEEGRCWLALSLDQFCKHGDSRSTLMVLESSSKLLLCEGRLAHATRLSGACEALRTRTGVVRDLFDEDKFGELTNELQNAMGHERYEDFVAAGRMLSLEEAVALALSGNPEI